MQKDSKHYETKTTASFAKKWNAHVEKASSIVIASHISPDDDAISCVLTMYEHLVSHVGKSDKDIQILFTGKGKNRWEYFLHSEKIQFVEDIADHLEGVDLLIMLDGSDFYRFSRKEELRDFTGDTLCIDHHLNPKDIHALHLVDTSYVSCAEILYKLFFQDEKEIAPRVAEIIFLGIWGDTGGLRFVRPDNLSAFSTIARLIQAGDINIQTLTSKYQKIPPEAIKVIGFLMDKTQFIQIDGWPMCQVSFLSSEITKSIDSAFISYGYHLYLDQYVRMIEGADWGFVVIPKTDGTNVCGISFRSLPGSVNVRKVAAELGGGGHMRAAGGQIDDTDPERSLQQVISWMRKNKPVLE